MTSELPQAPTSGRRRATPPAAKRDLGRWTASMLVAAVIALVGSALVLAGGLQATVFASSSVSQATLLSPRQPVITTAVGLLSLEGPRVRVDATDGSRRPVFLGIGRAADVDAYLAQVSRLEVTGHDGDGGLLTTRIGLQSSLPDPAGVDVWAVSARGTQTANLTWPQTPGQWRLVVATDGSTAAPDNLKLTWSGREVRSKAPTLISIGLVLTVAGLITLVALGSRSWRGGGR